MTMRPSLSLSSFRSADRQRMAMTSEAAVMSKPVSRAMPRRGPPMPTTTSRSTRSSMSMTLFQVMVRGHGMDVAGEMEVDVVARGDLGMSAARGPALEAEDRAERRLSDGG